MQAVIGADVARVTRLAAGGVLNGTHGLAQGGAVHEEARYEVVGVLAPSGTVLDRLILTDKASVWRVHEGDPADDAVGHGTAGGAPTRGRGVVRLWPATRASVTLEGS